MEHRHHQHQDRKKFSSLFDRLNNQRGVALMLVLFTFTLLAVLITELSYDTTVEHNSVSHDLSRIQARYSAKAGVEFSLLRILLYKQATALFADKLPKEKQGLLEMAWSFPIPWPMSTFMNNNPDVSAFTRDEINKIERDSLFKGNFNSLITPEETKIDINGLGSPIKAVHEYTKKQILNIFTSKAETDQEFALRHGDIDFEELVNNLIDWVDEDTESKNGGNESELYSDHMDGENLPPNTHFKTLDEIQRVAGMKDEFFNMLKNQITIYGAMGININHAPPDLIEAIDPDMQDETMTELLKRRSDPDLGPFTDYEQFKDYMESLDPGSLARMEEIGVPLLFGQQFNFHINVTSVFGKINYQIEATTYDFDNLKEKYIESLEKQDENEEDNDPQSADGGADPQGNPVGDTGNPQDDKSKTEEKNKNKPKPPTGRPLIVDWKEGI